MAPPVLLKIFWNLCFQFDQDSPFARFAHGCVGKYWSEQRTDGKVDTNAEKGERTKVGTSTNPGTPHCTECQTVEPLVFLNFARPCVTQPRSLCSPCSLLFCRSLIPSLPQGLLSLSQIIISSVLPLSLNSDLSTACNLALSPSLILVNSLLGSELIFKVTSSAG